MKTIKKKMMLKLRLLAAFWLLSIGYATAQIGDYTYLRELKGKTDTWHQVSIPSEFYVKTQKNLHDIRIYGITPKGDTIEAPYLLEEHDREFTIKEVDFKLINKSTRNGDAYFTFQVPTDDIINQIKLDFNNTNFDWRVTLEGSQDQQEWFQVKRRQRILSINNSYTNYAYTTIRFPESQYRYWRIKVKGSSSPKLNRAYLRQTAIIEGNYSTYPIMKFNSEVDKERKQTIIGIDLLDEVPVSSVQLLVKDSFDYYRPIRLEYLTRANTAKPYYNSLSSGMLTSFEDNSYQFTSQITDGIRCTIDNRDNQALQIDSAIVLGPTHTLSVRFTQEADYYLVYGNPNAYKPSYDIVAFKDKIPENMKQLALGREMEIAKSPIVEKSPLFINQIWLWAILIVLVAVIGTFGYKMMKQ